MINDNNNYDNNNNINNNNLYFTRVTQSNTLNEKFNLTTYKESISTVILM